MDYATTKKELLTVLFAFNIFWSCRIVSNMIVYIDYEALKFWLSKRMQDQDDFIGYCIFKNLT